jgi:hypothetical protein
LARADQLIQHPLVVTRRLLSTRLLSFAAQI